MLQITDSQRIVFGVPTVTDKRGNPTTVQNPVLSSSDATVLAVTDNGDGSGFADATGTLGTAVFTLDADADLGEGVVAVQGTLEVEVKAGNAAIVNINVSAVEEQPEAPPA